MRFKNLCVALAVTLLPLACTYEPYADLVCSSDTDCATGSQCMEGLCVGPSVEPDSGPGEAVNIAITPATAELAPGATAEFTASVTDANGNEVDVLVVWSSDAESVASINQQGTVTALADGETTISATAGELIAQATVSVVTPVDSVEVMPASVAIGVGTSEQVTATALDRDGQVLMNRDVIWISQDAAIATVDQSGLVRGVAIGSTVVTATVDNVTAEVTVEVTETLPASIEITPTDGRVSVATGTMFEAIVRDDQNRTIDQSTLGADWAWSNTDVSWDEHINFPAGVRWRFNFTPDAEEVGTGTINLTMTAGEVVLMDSVAVEIYIPAISSVTTMPAGTADVAVGETIAATYEAIDEDGNVNTLEDPTWESSDTDVATVDSDGNIVGVGPGTATITVTVGGESATIEVDVEFYLASIAVGDDHACGLTAAGVAYCWGSNSKGQLGDNSKTTSSTPVKVDTTEVFDSITAGFDVSCALTAAGTAFCWGEAAHVGDDGGMDQETPVAVAGGFTFSSIRSEFKTTCGITATGDARCWGIGADGQIGDGLETDFDTPTLVDNAGGALTWNTIGTGDQHSCAVDSADLLFCWGVNDDKRLGNDATAASAAPTPATTSEVFVELQLGQKGSCGLTATGAMFCWGDDAESATGTGLGGDVGVPTAVQGGKTWLDFDMGKQHVCAIEMGTNIVHCWGKFDNGRLGFMATENVATPTPLTGMFTAKAVDLAGDYSCAIDMTDIPFCWGESGETPTRVWPRP